MSVPRAESLEEVECAKVQNMNTVLGFISKASRVRVSGGLYSASTIMIGDTRCEDGQREAEGKDNCHVVESSRLQPRCSWCGNPADCSRLIDIAGWLDVETR